MIKILKKAKNETFENGLKQSLVFFDDNSFNALKLYQSGNLDFAFYIDNVSPNVETRKVLEIEISKAKQPDIFAIFENFCFANMNTVVRLPKTLLNDKVYMTTRGRELFTDGGRQVFCSQEAIEGTNNRNKTTIIYDLNKITIQTERQSFFLGERSVEINTSRGEFVPLIENFSNFWKASLEYEKTIEVDDFWSFFANEWKLKNEKNREKENEK